MICFTHDNVVIVSNKFYTYHHQVNAYLMTSDEQRRLYTHLNRFKHMLKMSASAWHYYLNKEKQVFVCILAVIQLVSIIVVILGVCGALRR